MNKVYQRLVGFTMVQVAIAGLLLTAFYYFTSFDDGSSLRSEVERLDTETAQEEAKKKDTDATLKEEARMKDMIGQLSQQYVEVSRRLPTSLSSIELNRHIDSFARNSGASIKARKPLANTRDEIVEQVPVQVNLEGSYAELAQFVYQVSISEQVTGIQAFTLVPVEKSSRLRFEGTVTGYQLTPEKKETAKTAGAAANAGAPNAAAGRTE